METLALPASATETATLRGASAQRPRGGLRVLLCTLSPSAWMFLDVAVVALTVCVSQAVLASLGHHWIAGPWLSATVFALAVVVAGLVFGLYERTTLLSRASILLRSTLTVALGIVLAFSLISTLFYGQVSRWMGLTTFVAYAACTVPIRLAAHHLLTTTRFRVLCLGGGESIRRLAEMLANRRRCDYELVGYIDVQGGLDRLLAGRTRTALAPRFRSEEALRFEEACPCLGRPEDLPEVIADEQIDEIVVGLETMSLPDVGRAVSLSLRNRCRVTDQTTFVEKLLGEAPVESVSAEWFLRADVQNHTGYEIVKRLLDLAAAALALVLTLPLWPLIAVLIRLESAGPAIYRQFRVGRHGRIFTMYKFRTMRIDAERDGPCWAQANDQRVTRLGRLLRRSRLDELPQLVNILRGDMSLVGPRPERPEFVRRLEELLPHYGLRHLVTPGLTGWAQIHYGYGASVEDAHRKLCYDLYYLKHRSIELDLAILIRTFGTFLLGGR